MKSYYFENLEEMISYSKIYNPGAEVAWAAGTDYLDQYKKGYALFDQGRLPEAIEAYQKALEFNPIGLSARFETAECYLHLGQFAKAKQILLEISKLTIRDKDKARFFRRYGYISTEEQNYKLAFSCFTYSLNFEQNPSVSNELMYIASIAKMNYKKIDVKNEISNAGLPLFEESPEMQQKNSASQMSASKQESVATAQKKGIFSAFINKHIK